MYLRQSEARIMSEVGFYAQEIGLTARELLELIYQNPNQAQSLIQDKLGIDIFTVFPSEP
jgi:DNA-binding CsgD family transcriptional regulator